MFKRSQICIVVFLLTCFYSCKHDLEDVRGCGEFTTYYDSKAFCSFNVGTYWVYENEITLERDTFTVYESGIVTNGGVEDGYFTRINRTLENAGLRYYQQESYNGSSINGNCVKRWVWLNRIEFNAQGEFENLIRSNIFLPVYEGFTFDGYCTSMLHGSSSNVVEEIKERNILNYQNIPTFTINGPSFALNGCEEHIYRFQMGQGIGLISWENLDLMDGKWRLIEFQPL